MRRMLRWFIPGSAALSIKKTQDYFARGLNNAFSCPACHARQLNVYFLLDLNLRPRITRINTNLIHHKEHPSSPAIAGYAVTCKEHKDFIATVRLRYSTPGFKRHPPSVALLHTAGHAKCTKIVSIFALLIVKAAYIAAYMQAYRSKSRHLHIQPVGLCSLFIVQVYWIL